MIFSYFWKHLFSLGGVQIVFLYPVVIFYYPTAVPALLSWLLLDFPRQRDPASVWGLLSEEVEMTFPSRAPLFTPDPLLPQARVVKLMCARHGSHLMYRRDLDGLPILVLLLIEYICSDFGNLGMNFKHIISFVTHSTLK